jgi:hypothetical protein
MIQLLISTEANVNTIKEEFNFQCATVSEMENGWLLIINEKDDFDDIEQAIEDEGDVLIVGSYNMDGSQYTWDNPNRNHTIQKYHGKLKPKKVYNEQTDEYDEIPYTEEEALNVQVNLIYGQPNRILI